MENEIALIAAGYVAIRLGIVATCALLLFKLATMRKPARVSLNQDQRRNRSDSGSRER